MTETEKFIVFAVKTFATFGIISSAVYAAALLWPHGAYLSANTIIGAGAVTIVIWGWYK